MGLHDERKAQEHPACGPKSCIGVLEETKVSDKEGTFVTVKLSRSAVCRILLVVLLL